MGIEQSGTGARTATRSGTSCWGARRERLANVILVIDTSGSVTLRVVRGIVTDGIPPVLHALGSLNGVEPKVEIILFSTSAHRLTDGFVSPREALDALERYEPKAAGVTNLAGALRLAIDDTARIKAEQDAAVPRPSRTGSSVFVFTDGRNTTEEGKEAPFPEDLAGEIRELADSHRLNFFAAGVGLAVPEELSKIAPPVRMDRSWAPDAPSVDYRACIYHDASGGSCPNGDDLVSAWSSYVCQSSSSSASGGSGEAEMAGTAYVNESGEVVTFEGDIPGFYTLVDTGEMD